MAVALILGFVILLLVYHWMTMKPKDFPPGPPYLPIVGSIFSMPKKLAHMTMAGEWRQKYGPVVGFFLGPRTAVAICGPREVLEVLRREEFQIRPDGDFFRERSFGKKLGIFFSDGPFWVEQRRFTLRHLRDFGFGKKSMEGFILDEVEDILLHMKDLKVMQVTGLFTVSALNVLWGMIAGIRYERNDERLQDLLKKLTEVFRAGNPTGPLTNIFPILKWIAPGLLGHTKTMDTLKSLQEFFRQSIREHHKSLDENNPRDLTDVYLKEMKRQYDNPDSTFTEEGLITICLDMFAAGGEATTSTLGFCLLYMVVYPEVQKKVQKELDAVVGRDRRPTLEDRAKLPYMEAVLTELLRVCSVAPTTPPHSVNRDTYVNGHFIPKDSMVLVNLYSLFQDKEHWGDPEVFRPERFLDADGKFVKDEWMIPFGVGKRVCVGEVLLRSVAFLFFTSIVQEFWLSVPEGDPKPSTVPLSGFTIAPAPFRVKVTKRA
ncbi:methyl farnesoate epoxidase-like [Periplaneta americana]|uniref:methyl farnesoate epoxidase-like n=1 Tax=Periplaneta americana TaxID=6978 RepID=UPI0037E9A95A